MDERLTESAIRQMVSQINQLEPGKLRLYALVTVTDPDEPGEVSMSISSNLPVFSKELQAVLHEAAVRMRRGRWYEKATKVRIHRSSRLRNAGLPGGSGRA